MTALFLFLSNILSAWAMDPSLHDALVKTLTVAPHVDAKAEIQGLEKKVAADTAREGKAVGSDEETALAQLRIGVLDEYLGNNGAAVAAYKQFESNFPRSQYRFQAYYQHGMILLRNAQHASGEEKHSREKEATRLLEGALRQVTNHEQILVKARRDQLKVEDFRYTVAQQLDHIYSNSFLYQTIDFFVQLSAPFAPRYKCGIAIILLTVVIKLVLYPLTKSQFKSMRDMQKIQPEIKKIQEKYKGDNSNPQAMNKETMDLYKQYGVNPLGGCLPLLIQMPVLIVLYRAILFYKFQFENAPFFWIKSLADPDMPLLGLYLISMVISQKLTTMPTADPQQQQTQKMMTLMMPVMFAFMFRTFPAAFILYWFVFNVMSTAQQYIIMKEHSPESGDSTAKTVKTLTTPPAPSPAAVASKPTKSTAEIVNSSSGTGKRTAKRKKRR